MNVFTLYIDGKNVNRYVDGDSFQEFSQRVEGENIWDMRLDSLSVELDKSVLSEFDIADTKTDLFYKKAAYLNYYGVKVFSGSVGEVDYDFDTGALELELHSIGKTVSDLNIASFNNHHSDGDTLPFSTAQIIKEINTALQSASFPFSLKEIPVIDVEDFPFYRSVEMEILPEQIFPSGIDYEGFRNITNNHLLGLYKDKEDIIPKYPKGYFLIYYINHGNVRHKIFLVPVNESGPDYDNIICYDPSWPEIIEAQYEKKYVLEDTGLKKNIEKQFGLEASDITYKGSVNYGDLIYYTVIEAESKHHIIKLNINQSDKFIYEYNDSKAGQILKDAAIMTNSITWISPEGAVYYISRSGISGLAVKHVENLKDKFVRYRKSFESPDAYVLLDSVKEALTAYYNTYLQGDFIRYTAIIERNEFIKSDYPIMLKSLPVDHKNLSLGLINAANYKENLIEVESLVKVDHSTSLG